MKPTVACSTAASGPLGAMADDTSNAQPNGKAAHPIATAPVVDRAAPRP